MTHCVEKVLELCELGREEQQVFASCGVFHHPLDLINKKERRCEWPRERRVTTTSGMHCQYYLGRRKA